MSAVSNSLRLSRSPPPPPPSRTSSESSSVKPYKSISPPRRPNFTLNSPLKIPPRGRKTSMSTNPMNWLSRTSQQSQPSKHSVKPSISEPKSMSGNGLDLWTTPKSGYTGATVVRTPQEALAGSSTRQSYESGSGSSEGDSRSVGKKRVVREGSKDSIEELYEGVEEYIVREKGFRELPSTPPDSPPLPPLPLHISTKSSPNLPLSTVRPSSPSPSLPQLPPPRTPRPAFKATRSFSPSPAISTYFPPVVPSVPSLPPPLLPQPPFSAHLLSPSISTLTPPSKLIITLETSTATYRTTYSTLTSRPSHLSTYLQSLLKQKDNEAEGEDDEGDEGESERERGDEESISSFNSMFYRHLMGEGNIAPAAVMSNIHIFLDRPSAPYEHILTYLRSLSNTSILPRSVHLTTPQPTRPSSLLGFAHAHAMERAALLDLRDEASYLGLEDLVGLCEEEIRSSGSNSNTGHQTGSGSNMNVNVKLGGTTNQQQDAVLGGNENSHKRGGSKSSLGSMSTLTATLRECPAEEEEEEEQQRNENANDGSHDRQARSSTSSSKSMGKVSSRTRPLGNWI